MSSTVGLSRWILFWTIALVGATFDITTKAIVFERIGPPHSPAVTLIPNLLELQTSYNTGALWGLGAGWQYSSLLFALLSLVAGGIIFYYLFVMGAAKDAKLTVALALIMAGALGNFYDRTVLGHVRDFVHFHIDPIGFDCAIFNFADNMLVAGSIVLMLLALRPSQTSTDAPSSEGEGRDPESLLATRSPQ